MENLQMDSSSLLTTVPFPHTGLAVCPYYAVVMIPSCDCNFMFSHLSPSSKSLNL